MAIKHAFTSEVADGADATLVQPSDWNADHTIEDATIAEAKLTLSDNTTADASSSKHGFCPKLSGSSSQYLNGEGSFAALPDIGARVNNSTDITLSHNSITALTFDTEDWDTDTMHSTTTNTSRLTATKAGKYLVVGMVWFNTNGTGIRNIYIYKNGSVVAQTGENTCSSANSTILNIVNFVDLAVNDYIELEAYQSSGGDLAVRALSGRTPVFVAQRIA
jgi:hypothetical protein